MPRPMTRRNAVPVPQALFGRALSLQRPAVLAYLRGIRRRHPDADPERITMLVTRHYVWAVTGGGTAVGASAVIPGIGTLAGLGLAAAETGGFLESTALYAQALAELAWLPVDDRARADALVLGIILGGSGRKLVREFASQAYGGHTLGGSGSSAQGGLKRPRGPSAANSAARIVQQGRRSGWAATVTSQLPQALINPLTKRLKHTLISKYAAGTLGSVAARILPFGVGAAAGGLVNNSMARSVVRSAREAFGPLPPAFPESLEPRCDKVRDSTDPVTNAGPQLSDSPAPDLSAADLYEPGAPERPRTHRTDRPTRRLGKLQPASRPNKHRPGPRSLTRGTR